MYFFCITSVPDAVFMVILFFVCATRIPVRVLPLVKVMVMVISSSCCMVFVIGVEKVQLALDDAYTGEQKIIIADSKETNKHESVTDLLFIKISSKIGLCNYYMNFNHFFN